MAQAIQALHRSFVLIFIALLTLPDVAVAEPGSLGLVSAGEYPSIQAAIDANPGKMVYLPNGDHLIQQKIRLNTDHSGLHGPGRIVQAAADEPIIEIENAREVVLRDISLSRSEGKMDTRGEGILAIKCPELTIENVRVIDNRTRAAAISLRECDDARIIRCRVKNYMRVTIEDRTGDLNWGYAFRCTDGTGILVNSSTNVLIESNHVVEENLLPTPEMKEKHKLGEWSKKNPVKGHLMNQQAWERAYTDNWQQGSGIVVTSPERSDRIRVLGNHIENAAQGIDLHADHVLVANNIVANSFVGMKAMHGSRNTLIIGNQFVKNTLWAIGLMPGVSSHTGNRDGGSLIANNIISDFGEGDAKWIWGQERSPFKFEHGQEPDDPPLTGVLIQGNVVHATETPRYRYAVVVEGEPGAPRDLRFSNNVFPAGTGGVANVELKP